MHRFIILLSFFHLLNAFAVNTSVCEEAPSSLSGAGLSDESDLSEFLKDNNVVLVNEVSLNHRVQFAYELRKFPRGLREHMARQNVEVRIMTGEGVTADPTFTDKITADGRRWSEVPGSGGNPTRIVANSLYRGHGASNLVLHEHAHTLDNKYRGFKYLSGDKEWQTLLRDNKELRKVITNYCGKYCLGSAGEAFAETLALYYGCEKGRKLFENSPETIAYFQKLEAFQL